MIRRVLFAGAAVSFCTIVLVTCGGGSSTPMDTSGSGGASGGASGAGGANTSAGGANTGGSSTGTGGTGVGCQPAGSTCASPQDCCSFICDNGMCGATQCTSQGQACSTSGQCCSRNCSGGMCAPLNPSCRTSGNTCSMNGECCSKLCNGGVCDGRVSFCTQFGDACTSDNECCGGLCNKAMGATLGTCSVPAVSGVPGCTPAGQACSGATSGDAGIAGPICGGDCCSRSCRPYAATGILICQPPSGCRPTGETCQSDNDCCGAPGAPGSTDTNGSKMTNVHCSKAAGAAIGRCDNGQACSPAGAICRLAVTSCNATDRCCSGTVQTHPLNCQQDLLGIPRCTVASDHDCKEGGVVPAGTACASSADCCDKPCVPNPGGNPPFVCGEGRCIPSGGACTTTADCCVGTSCNVPPGMTTGTCGTVPPPPPPPPGDSGTPTPDSGTPTPDGGPTCAQYGQTCTQNSDCCNTVPCTGGRCVIIVN